MKAMEIIPSNPELKGMAALKTDIAFAAPDGRELKLQLALPMGAREGSRYPLVVFLQGSAFTTPDPFFQMPQLCRLAQRGIAVGSITHRSVLDGYPAPTYLIDAKSAIRFLRANADAYGIDPGRVAMWGTSSGGNTALLVGLTGDFPEYKNEVFPEQSDKVCVVVDCFGPTDMEAMLPGGPDAIDNEELMRLIVALSGGDIAGFAGLAREISPLRRVEEGKDYPPFLLLHGDADDVVLFRQSESMWERLLECGAEADLVRVAGAPHEGPFWSDEVHERVYAFLKAHL